MSHKTPSLKRQERQAEHAEPHKTTGRLRSACDSCHQSKVRCSGEDPCLTCQVYQVHCTYSPGRRLGRPKGSRNKKIPMQESNRNKRDERQEDKNSSGEDPGLQQQPDTMFVEYNFEQREFDAAFADDLFAHINNEFLPEDDLDILLTQASTVFDQPYGTLPFETPDSSKSNSRNTACTASQSPIDPTFFESQQGPPATFTMPESTQCSCLQQLVQLVYQLGELQYSYAGSSTVDRALQGVQRAQGPWKSLMQCNKCQSQGNQKEVFLMFAMSIRIILSLVQKLKASANQAYDSPHEAAIGQAISGASNVSVSVGNFELTGETKSEVIGVVIRRALQIVTTSIIHMRERAGRSRQLPTPDFNGSSGGGSTIPESPNSNFTGILTESQKPPYHNPPTSPNLGAEDIKTLLDTLQRNMQAMQQDLGVRSKMS